MLRPEHQSAWMLKITNDDLMWSGTGCFIAVPIWQTVGVKGLTEFFLFCIRSVLEFFCDAFGKLQKC